MSHDADRIILAYIAGRFTAPTREGVEANIRKAEALALEVAALGVMPACPHSNTSHPSFETVQDYDFWIAGTMKLLRRCDIVVFTDDYALSKGACGEEADAMKRGQPRFYTIDALKQWLAEREEGLP